MSDNVKPYTLGDVPDEMTCTDCGEPDCCLMNEQSRIITTVEALEKAVAHGTEEESLKWEAIHRAEEAEAERDEWKTECERLMNSIKLVPDAEQAYLDGLMARADAMEAERDVARAALVSQREHIEMMSRERREALAEVARLQDLHTRCAAFDDQPGPSCVTLAAKCAALREALVTIERTGAPGATIVAQRDDGHSCSWCRGMVTPCPTATARAALAGTSDKEGR